MTNVFSLPRPWWRSMIFPIFLFIIGLFVSSDSFLTYLAIAFAISYILTSSFNLLYGYAGIFSLAHVSIYGIGAYAAVLLQMRLDVPFIFALLAAMIICAITSLLIWYATRHLHHLFFAIATLGLEVTIEELMAKWTGLTGGAVGILGIPFAQIGGFEIPANSLSYYWFVAIGAAASWEISARLTSSAMGRKFVAHRGSPIGIAALGIAPSRVRLVAFIISGMLAGMAGTMFAYQSLFISPEAFGLHRLIILILALLIGGAGTMFGPVFGVLVLVLIDELGAINTNYNTLIFGVAIIAMLGYWQGGIAGIVTYWIERIFQKKIPKLVPSHLTLSHTSASGKLTVSNVSVVFGGVQALREVSMELGPGEVLGLIGPNGAGKTTLINCITGYVMPGSGEIKIGSRRIDGLRPEEIARCGVVRTFQSMRLLPDVSVIGNVVLGYSTWRTASDLGEVLDTPKARADSKRDFGNAAELLKILGINDVAWKSVSSQPYAIRKLAEVGRALACGPAFLLLDEPGAGLNEIERDRLRILIRQLADAGIGVLVIDHNVSFIAAVADRVHVLNYGQTLAYGNSVREVLDRPEVIGAYVGAMQ